MKIISAIEAETHFEKYMDDAMLEPIMVNGTEGESIVMLSKEVYDYILQVSKGFRDDGDKY